MENVNGHDQVEEAIQAAEAEEEAIVEVSMDELKNSFISKEVFEKEIDPLIDAVMDKCKEYGVSLSMHSAVKAPTEDGHEEIAGVDRTTLGAYVPSVLLKSRLYYRHGAKFMAAMHAEKEFPEAIYHYKSEKNDDGVTAFSLVGSVGIKQSEESEATNEQAA